MRSCVLKQLGWVSTYLGLDLKGALLVVVHKCFYGFLFVVGYSVEDFAPHLGLFQHSLQTGRVLIDVLTKDCEGIRLGIPKSGA